MGKITKTEADIFGEMLNNTFLSFVQSIGDETPANYIIGAADFVSEMKDAIAEVTIVHEAL